MKSNLQVVTDSPDIPQQPAPTLADIMEAINRVNLEIAAIPNHRAPYEIEAEIQSTAARALIDPALKPHLEDLINSKHLAEEAITYRQKLNGQLARFQRDLDLAHGEERKHKANAASRDLEQATDEFVAASKQVVRSYRRCMNLQRRNAGIPGAATALNVDMSFLFLSGSPYSGFTIMDEMKMSLLPFELKEGGQ